MPPMMVFRSERSDLPFKGLVLDTYLVIFEEFFSKSCKSSKIIHDVRVNDKICTYLVTLL